MNLRVDIPARADDSVRAARYLHVARLLGLSDVAYEVADDALEAEVYDDPTRDALLLLAQASFTSDDDYDDFRYELRAALGILDEDDMILEEDDVDDEDDANPDSEIEADYSEE